MNKLQYVIYSISNIFFVFTVFPHLFISAKNAFSDLICSVGFLSMNNMETRGPECSAEFLEVEAVGLF